MFPFSIATTDRRTLEADDRAALCELYPAANGTFTSKTDLVNRINASVGTNVYAKLDEKGDIELQTDMPGGIGIGTDLVAVARIAEVLARQPVRFPRRVLVDTEIEAFRAAPD